MKILRFYRYFKMFTSKSSFHIEQGLGKRISKDSIEGYYNDLTGKVSEKTQLDLQGIPVNTTHKLERIHFFISIAQYAIGNYDKYLLTNEGIYLKNFLKISEWLLDKQDYRGGFDISNVLYSDIGNNYSSMAQSEIASVFIRAYKETTYNKFLIAAKKSIDLMITPIEQGGTMRVIEDKIFFEEVVRKDPYVILNGWIFSIYGLFDIIKVCDDEIYKEILNTTLNTLKDELSVYDIKFWTYYAKDGTVASPAYHALHVAQLESLYYLTGDIVFKNYYEKWDSYRKDSNFTKKAIIRKSIQKLIKPENVVLIK